MSVLPDYRWATSTVLSPATEEPQSHAVLVTGDGELTADFYDCLCGQVVYVRENGDVLPQPRRCPDCARAEADPVEHARMTGALLQSLPVPAKDDRPTIIYVRLLADQLAGQDEGLRTIHSVLPTPESASPSRMVTLCGIPFEPGEIELVTIVDGAPCNECWNMSILAGQLVQRA
jgi:hypothetical protein